MAETWESSDRIQKIEAHLQRLLLEAKHVESPLSSARAYSIVLGFLDGARERFLDALEAKARLLPDPPVVPDGLVVAGCSPMMSRVLSRLRGVGLTPEFDPGDFHRLIISPWLSLRVSSGERAHLVDVVFESRSLDRVTINRFYLLQDVVDFFEAELVRHEALGESLPG